MTTCGARTKGNAIRDYDCYYNIRGSGGDISSKDYRLKMVINF